MKGDSMCETWQTRDNGHFLGTTEAQFKVNISMSLD